MKVMVFGGTTEGRRLCAALAKTDVEVMLSVATTYGQHVADLSFKDSGMGKEVQVMAERLDQQQMQELFVRSRFDCVIDATHPYAVAVTAHIRSACDEVGIPYYRLTRPPSTRNPQEDVIRVPDATAAAEVLKGDSAKVLLTTGSKDLESFTHLEGFEDRVYVRILPMEGSLKKALELGFRADHIICMQGPFSVEMNQALLKACGATYLVTKESGEVGGFEEKIMAANSLGCQVIVLDRPVKEEGYGLEDLLGVLGLSGACHQDETPFFPLFFDLRGKRLLVVGGGTVAQRRIHALEGSGAQITLISSSYTAYLGECAARGELVVIRRHYATGDVAKMRPFMVIAATDDREVNHRVREEACSLDIPISVADCREECTCYFPAVARSERFVAGLVSTKGDHASVREKAAYLRECLQ